MNLNLTKSKRGTRSLRVHAAYEQKPLCGGGNGGKAANWQLDLAPCNCKACLKILGGGGVE